MKEEEMVLAGWRCVSFRASETTGGDLVAEAEVRFDTEAGEGLYRAAHFVRFAEANLEPGRRPPVRVTCRR